MILSQTAGSVSSGFIDEPQDEDAQPPAFTVASNWSPNVVLRLSSEIAGADIERLRCWECRSSKRKSYASSKSGFGSRIGFFVSDSVGLPRTLLSGYRQWTNK
ncbi:hypothetical protein NKH14_24105 [Mesorhizobium sp. M1380]|uniref:hypothetical protein n=1 Tax=Mesorhizobium sp. M1380 TaxID=2957093 RepID=UPI00333D9AB4